MYRRLSDDNYAGDKPYFVSHMTRKRRPPIFRPPLPITTVGAYLPAIPFQDIVDWWEKELVRDFRIDQCLWQAMVTGETVDIRSPSKTKPVKQTDEILQKDAMGERGQLAIDELKENLGTGFRLEKFDREKLTHLLHVPSNLTKSQIREKITDARGTDYYWYPDADPVTESTWEVRWKSVCLSTVYRHSIPCDV